MRLAFEQVARAYALPNWLACHFLPTLVEALGVPSVEARGLQALPRAHDEASARAWQRQLRGWAPLTQVAGPGSALAGAVCCAFDEVVDCEDARRVREHACQAVAEGLALLDAAFWEAFTHADTQRTQRLLEAERRICQGPGSWTA